ncbi:tRNA (guanine37-N1) -methyltransferase [Vibrio maritimus]|uniref:tRNA (Guanine37-N1)-methyltransferase n=1 Tax=Vibrio maritimus TaxID=990268 RepID=A0A090T8I0_9VIBR|nr:tRNA (guanine37-N1) -methyltransferase [Vibrio maritimus]
MWVGVISLFPDMFRSVTDYGVTGQAVKKGLLSIETWNPRDFTHDKHRTVDDRPYGGGPGMLMMVQPLRDAIHAPNRHHRVRRKSFTFLLKVASSTKQG